MDDLNDMSTLSDLASGLDEGDDQEIQDLRKMLGEKVGRRVREQGGKGGNKFVWLYNTKTGEPSKFPRWHAYVVLGFTTERPALTWWDPTDPMHGEMIWKPAKMLPDGSHAPPEGVPALKAGEQPCYFNPSHPRYQELLDKGLVPSATPCTYRKGKSESMVRAHMEAKHQKSWARVKEMDRDEREERLVQSQIESQRLMAQVAGGRAPTAEREPHYELPAAVRGVAQPCTATTASGNPCKGKATASGLCAAHSKQMAVA